MIRYKVFSKPEYKKEWQLSGLHSDGLPFFNDINDAYRAIEKRQKSWPDHDFEIKEIQ